MAKILKLTVTKLDGTEKTYSVLPVTKVAFEREFKCGLGTMKETQREEQVYWLAWDATKRAGEVVKPFDDWINDLLDVTVQDDAVLDRSHRDVWRPPLDHRRLARVWPAEHPQAERAIDAFTVRCCEGLDGGSRNIRVFQNRCFNSAAGA